MFAALAPSSYLGTFPGSHYDKAAQGNYKTAVHGKLPCQASSISFNLFIYHHRTSSLIPLIRGGRAPPNDASTPQGINRRRLPSLCHISFQCSPFRSRFSAPTSLGHLRSVCRLLCSTVWASGCTCVRCLEVPGHFRLSLPSPEHLVASDVFFVAKAPSLSPSPPTNRRIYMRAAYVRAAGIPPPLIYIFCTSHGSCSTRGKYPTTHW